MAPPKTEQQPGDLSYRSLAPAAPAKAPCTQSPHQVPGQGGHHAKALSQGAGNQRCGKQLGALPWGVLGCPICYLCSSLHTPKGKGRAGGAGRWSANTGTTLGRFLCGWQPLRGWLHPRTEGDPDMGPPPALGTWSCVPSTGNFRVMGPGRPTQVCGYSHHPLCSDGPMAHLASGPPQVRPPSPAAQAPR